MHRGGGTAAHPVARHSAPGRHRRVSLRPEHARPPRPATRWDPAAAPRSRASRDGKTPYTPHLGPRPLPPRDSLRRFHGPFRPGRHLLRRVRHWPAPRHARRLLSRVVHPPAPYCPWHLCRRPARYAHAFGRCAGRDRLQTLGARRVHALRVSRSLDSYEIPRGPRPARKSSLTAYQRTVLTDRLMADKRLGPTFFEGPRSLRKWTKRGKRYRRS